MVQLVRLADAAPELTRVCKRGEVDRARLLVPVEATHLVSKVGVGAPGRRAVILECEVERVLEQCDRLLLPTAPDENEVLRIQRVGQSVRQPQGLRDLERELDTLACPIEVAQEEILAR